MCCRIVLFLSYTVATTHLSLIPFSSDVPSAETLMARIVACEMAMLYEQVLNMAARECDLLIKAHSLLCRWYGCLFGHYNHCQLVDYGGTLQTYIEIARLWLVLEIWWPWYTRAELLYYRLLVRRI
jgi:hypothetical protein